MTKRRDRHKPGTNQALTTPAPAPARASNGLRAFLFGTLGQLAAAPIIGMFSGFLLLFGGIFLAFAWTMGPQPLIDALQYAPFTAHAQGRIVDSWAAIDFDPHDLPPGKLYWHNRSQIAACVVVDYEPAPGPTIQRAFCGNRFAFRDDFRFEDWRTLAPGVPFAFRRDASGFAVEEIRLGKIALDWLSTHPPKDTFMLSKPAPATALAALKEQLDRPLDVAIASWSMPVPAFPLAYDPAHPDQAMPAAIVSARHDGLWLGLIFAVLFAVPGIWVWRIGIGWLTGQAGVLLWFLTLLPLLALPWWSDALPRIVRYANADWADIATDMLGDINRVTHLDAGAPADAAQVDGERIEWHVQSGLYADTFGRLQFRLPQPAPASPQAAREALRTQICRQVAGFDPAARTALFARLREQNDAFARNVQPLFDLAGEDTLRDAAAGAAAHRAARDFLILASGGNYYDDQLDKIENTAKAPQPSGIQP